MLARFHGQGGEQRRRRAGPDGRLAGWAGSEQPIAWASCSSFPVSRVWNERVSGHVDPIVHRGSRMKNPSKHRSCPALGVDIPTSDCRALRNTSIACTADCPSNPFTVANCERLHAVERSVNATSLPIGLALPDEIVRVDLIEPGGRVANPGRFAAFLVQQALHVERDLDGKTRANRWIEAGLPGLETNDERALFRAIARMRIALMETRRVMDANRLEVVDLLRPGEGPFILMDPDHWRWAVRYGLSLARVFELPHFHRCAGRALSLPDFHGLESAWVAREVAMHLGWEPSGMAIGDWLMANQIDFLRSWLETRKACAADANKASQLRNCWAVYELRDSAGECHAAVHARRWIRHGSFQPGVMKGPAMAFFDWFDPCPGNPTRARLLARIYAGDHKWIIHSASEPVLAEARRQFEQAMGDRVAFADEETSELDGFPLAPATPEIGRAHV